MIFTAICDGCVEDFSERKQTMQNKSFALDLHHRNQKCNIISTTRTKKTSVLLPSLSISQETRTIFPVTME